MDGYARHFASILTLVVSTVEQQLLNRLAPESRVMVLSTIHEPLPQGKPFADREGLVFIGSFRHPPNVDGVTAIPGAAPAYAAAWKAGLLRSIERS